MDRVIEKKKNKTVIFSSLFVSMGVIGLLYASVYNNVGSHSVSLTDIKTHQVARASFEESISFVGEVEPKQVYFIDAVEGGVVRAVSAKNGQIVNEGESIVELSNSSLVLQVIRSEAEISQQVNNLNNLEIELEKNKLSHLKELLDTDFAIKNIERELKNLKFLSRKGIAEKDKIQKNEDELAYLLQKRELIKKAQDTDLQIQTKQMTQLNENTERLKDSLQFTKENLSSLNVVAPTNGLLTDFYVRKGQSLNKGDRIARIDNIDEMILVTKIDEFHSSSIQIGNIAKVKSSGLELTMQVSRVYPEITEGLFRVDLSFVDKLPSDVKRGRKLTGKIQLQNPRLSLVFPNQQTAKYTADKWVFVLDPERKFASKRFIETGAKNGSFVEVVSGLKEGEEIIVSSYKNLQEHDRITLE